MRYISFNEFCQLLTLSLRYVSFFVCMERMIFTFHEREKSNTVCYQYLAATVHRISHENTNSQKLISGRAMGLSRELEIWPKFYIGGCAGCNIVLYHTAIYREPRVSYFLSKQSFCSFANTCYYQVQPSLLGKCQGDFAIDRGALMDWRRWCIEGGGGGDGRVWVLRQPRGPSHRTRITCIKVL